MLQAAALGQHLDAWADIPLDIDYPRRYNDSHLLAANLQKEVLTEIMEEVCPQLLSKLKYKGMGLLPGGIVHHRVAH